MSAASLRLACGHPVRRFVASSGETAGVDEGLGQGHTRPVAPEPIARQTPQAGAEDVAGPMRHLNPRQDEEPRVAAHHLQVALPRGGVPPDPLAAGLAFPSGRSKEQASEGTAIMSSDEILHVLADRPIEAKVVTSSHEMVERRLIPRKAAGIHDAHWLYLRDPAAEGRPVHFHDRHCRRATRASSPPGGKFDQRARFQLESSSRQAMSLYWPSGRRQSQRRQSSRERAERFHPGFSKRNPLIALTSVSPIKRPCILNGHSIAQYSIDVLPRSPVKGVKKFQLFCIAPALKSHFTPRSNVIFPKKILRNALFLENFL